MERSASAIANAGSSISRRLKQEVKDLTAGALLLQVRAEALSNK
jgi:hypothetical protein